MMFTAIHPTRRALVRFAGGDAPEAERRRVGQHTLTCARCRDTVTFARSIAEVAAALPAPAPSADLLQRVLAGRAAGERIILPAIDAPSQRGRRTITVYAMAAVLLVAVGISIRSALRQPHDAPVMDTAPVMRGSLYASGFFTTIASAQEPPRPGKPTPAPVIAIDGTRLRAGETQYEERWTDSIGHAETGSRQSERVARTTIAGRAAWRLEHVLSARSADGLMHIEAETLWVDQRTLQPLERRVHIAPHAEYDRLDITQGFNGDSMVGHVTAARAGTAPFERSFLRRLDPASGPFVTDALSSVFLTGVELGPHWAGRLSVVGWALVDRDVLHPVTLRVMGAERITVPAGTFDCWRMSVSMDGHSYVAWVRQSDGLGVRTRDESARRSRGVREVLLVQ
jgi:hypothetical protein